MDEISPQSLSRLARFEASEKEDQKKRRIFAVTMVGILFLLLLLGPGLNPGYYRFFHTDLGWILASISIGWYFIGVAIAATSSYRLSKAVVLLIIFSTPPILVAMLAPAVFTIIEALHKAG